MLETAFEKLRMLRGGERVVHEGGAFGDALNDSEIAADVYLGDVLTEMIHCESSFASITVEGRERLEGAAGGSCHWFIDPLDGSLNYKTRGASMGLPYSAVVTVAQEGLAYLPLQPGELSFHSIVSAGVVDLRNGDAWTHLKTYQVVDGDEAYFLTGTLLNGSPVQTMQETTLDLGRMIVIGEMYYPESRERLMRAFSDAKGWLRNPGSAGYEMALVASGQAAAYICDRQKQHELGAAYLLVRGAGGVAVDFEGKDLGDRIFDFKTQTPVVLAANQQIAEQVLERLNR